MLSLLGPRRIRSKARKGSSSQDISDDEQSETISKFILCRERLVLNIFSCSTKEKEHILNHPSLIVMIINISTVQKNYFRIMIEMYTRGNFLLKKSKKEKKKKQQNRGFCVFRAAMRHKSCLMHE